MFSSICNFFTEEANTLRHQCELEFDAKVTASSCPGAGRVEWQHTGFFEAKTLKITAGSTPTLSTALRRDRDSLLTGVGALVLTRNPLNGLLSGTTLNQISDSYRYNSFAEPTNYSVTTPLGSVFSQSFLRDKLGRITQKTETVNAVTTTFNYGYDAAGRLETVRENNVLTVTYGFDGNSNRTAKITPAGTVSGTFDAQDRMNSYGGCSYLYTANGEMTRKTCGSAITQFDIDVMGNLRSVTLPDSTQIRYLIDGANRRIGKLRNNVLEKPWLWQSQLRPAAQLDIAGNAQQFYLYGEKLNVPSYLVNRENGVNVTYRVISDHLGSVRLVVNADTGVVAQRLRYDEFGVVLEDTNPGFQPFGFAGGFYDADTGLVRFGARDYDAGVGRWLGKDHRKFQDSFNLYEYVKSDPVNYIDPNGELTISIDGAMNAEQVKALKIAIEKIRATGKGQLKLGDIVPGAKPFDDARGPIQCSVDDDGNITGDNSGKPFKYTDENGDTYSFDKKVSVELQSDKNGIKVPEIDGIKGRGFPVDSADIKNNGDIKVSVCTIAAWFCK